MRSVHNLHTGTIICQKDLSCKILLYLLGSRKQVKVNLVFTEGYAAGEGLPGIYLGVGEGLP